MSLTYSLNHPGQKFPRVTVIALIAFLHVGAFVAFNNGIGHFFKTDPPPDMTVVEVPTEPPVENRVPIPDIPKSLPDQPITPPIVEPTDIVIDVPPTISESAPSEATDVSSGPTIPTVSISKLTVTSRTDPIYPASAQAARNNASTAVSASSLTLMPALLIMLVMLPR